MIDQTRRFGNGTLSLIVGLPVLSLMIAAFVISASGRTTTEEIPAEPVNRLNYRPRQVLDTSGFWAIGKLVEPWNPDATLIEIRDAWQDIGPRTLKEIEHTLSTNSRLVIEERISMMMHQAEILNSEGEPRKAYHVLGKLRSLVESDEASAELSLYSVIFFQGITALRLGENENCIMCRGESSCIIPISEAARHEHPEGSRLAILHYTEYLAQFPDDLEARWLLNVAHMTLGEHPDNVDARYLVPLDHFARSEFSIGRFRDIGHLVGLNQFTQAGGSIMDDFDNDGLLDVVITAGDATEQMQILRNTGDGTFEERTRVAGLTGQLGGLNCMQTDFNNDGHMDIFVVRGAWIPHPIRPTLLRNDGNGNFVDVTESAGLMEPLNSIAASWSDYDNDGWLDVFVCCERQPSRLYHNRGNSTFEEVAEKAKIRTPDVPCKGSAWIDYDNDGYQDLFLSFLSPVEPSRLFRNNRDGSFTDLSESMGIDGPRMGFSCWSWDFDNDGWLDVFATSYDRSLGDIVKGLLGVPHRRESGRLFRNLNGTGFKDISRSAGLDGVYAAMGSNFGDFDNDGFLDIYLGTGDPNLETLVPNRMFRNVAGLSFSDITASSGTGNLQKGHGVACGDWDRDGNTDIFIEMGGAANGDKYHNILLQNPGHQNNWLTVKLSGEKTNRPAIGARIKVVTAGDNPQTFYRTVSSGSSFGANPLQQTIGLAKADRVAILEIHWPTTGTTQIFRDLNVDQAISVTEFAEDYQVLDWTPIKFSEQQ